MARVHPNDRPLTPAEQLATEAWEVHCALMRMEAANQALRQNSLWAVHHADAFEHYVILLERC